MRLLVGLMLDSGIEARYWGTDFVEVRAHIDEFADGKPTLVTDCFSTHFEDHVATWLRLNSMGWPESQRLAKEIKTNLEAHILERLRESDLVKTTPTAKESE